MTVLSYLMKPQLIYLSYGEYLYSEECEASKAIDIFRRGLENIKHLKNYIGAIN